VDLAFKLEDRSIQVEVKTSVSRQAAAARELAEMRKEQQLQELSYRQQVAQLAASQELALRLIGVFVDDHSYRFDERTGGLRVRLTKYRIS